MGNIVGYWQDKIAIVTGGSSGLGKELAAQLLKQNATVILLARDASRLDAAQADLAATSALPVTTRAVDVTDEQACRDAIEKIVAAHGRIDAVFNCVGKSTRESVLDVDAEQLKTMMDINLHSVVNMTRACISELEKSSGHLVNIGSLASKTAWPFVTSYAISKSAMATYTHQLRLEAPSAVHYLLVCPGPIRRDDTGTRYENESSNLPEHARKAGAGVKVKGIDPEVLTSKILRACVKRKRELIVPGYTRLAFIASAISPALGDWILRKKSG